MSLTSDEKANIFAEIVQETVMNEVKNRQTAFKSQNKEDLLKLEAITTKIKQSKYGLVKWFVGMFFDLAVMISRFVLQKIS